MDTIPSDGLQGKPVYIYTLSSPSEPDKIRYVGKTIRPKTRLTQHMNDKSSTHRGNWLSSLRSQGIVPIMTVIEETTSDKWKEREIFWVAFYRSQGCSLVNATEGGDGHEHTPESLAKIAAGQYGRKASPEKRAKLSESHKGQPNAMKGKQFSAEVRANMSAARLGKKFGPLTDERKRKISDGNKDKKVSAETRARLSASHMGKPSPKKGRKMSPESRARMSSSKKQMYAMRKNPPNAPTLWE